MVSIRATDIWLIKGMPESLWELEGCVKIGQVDAHLKNPLPSSEGDWHHQVDPLVGSVVAPEPMI